MSEFDKWESGRNGIIGTLIAVGLSFLGKILVGEKRQGEDVMVETKKYKVIKKK